MNNNNRPTQTADRAWLDYQSSAQTYFDLRDRARKRLAFVGWRPLGYSTRCGMSCWWISRVGRGNRQFAERRRSAQWLPADHATGRTFPRSSYGKISGRTNVGFEEENWRFILWLSKEMGMTISETIRDCVTSCRKECERGAFEEGEKYPWTVKDKSHD